MSDAQPVADVQEDVAATVPTTEEPSPTVMTESEGEVALDSEDIQSLDDLEYDTPDVEPEESADTTNEEGEDAVKEDGEEGESEETEADPEMRTYDFGGNKLEFALDAVPPELATKIDDFSKGVWSSATKAHQQTAERSKSLDSQEATVAKIAELNGAALETYTRGLQLKSDIEHLSSANLPQLWQSDPDRARQISDALADKQQEFQQTLAQVQQQEGDADAAKQHRLAGIAAEGVAQLNKKFKNFSTEKAPALLKHIKQQHPNISQREMDTWAQNPVITEYAYKAMLYDQQTQAKVKPNKQPTKAKPVRGIKSKGNATSNRAPDDMSMGALRKHLSLRG
jgi:hypothetical protein